jgi:hypothetical protein
MEGVMRMRWFVALGFVVAVGLSILVGQLVFILERTFPTQYATPMQLPSAADLMNGVDKTGGMMFSLTLGLFVLAGFALRGMGQQARASRYVIVTAAGFLFASILSIYMGFLARSVALYYASFAQPGSVGLAGTFLILQALGVAGSGLAAILLLLESLAENTETDHPPSSSEVGDVARRMPGGGPRRKAGKAAPRSAD